MREKLVTSIVTAAVLGIAQCVSAALIITGVVDGPRPDGTPKAIELYATTAIADLSIYNVETPNNGAAAAGSEFALSGSAAAGQFLYIASESTEFNNYFGFAPTFTSGVANINGDDNVILYQNAATIDQFGVNGQDGSGEAWDYLDSYAYRNNGTGPDAVFAIGNWTFGGVDFLDSQTSTGTNGSDGKTVPFGTYQAAVINNDTDISVAPTAVAFGQWIKGSAVPSQNVTVSEDSDGSSPSTTYQLGANALAAQVSLTNTSGSVNNGANGAPPVSVNVDSSTAGSLASSFTIDNVGNPADTDNQSVSVTGAILNGANPSFESVSDTNGVTIDLGDLVADGGVQSFSPLVSLFNLGSPGNTVALDLTGQNSAGDAQFAVTNLNTGSVPVGGSIGLGLQFDVTRSGVGPISRVITLAGSDDDLFGGEAVFGALAISGVTITLQANLVPVPEPSTALLALLGLVGLAGFRRRG